MKDTLQISILITENQEIKEKNNHLASANEYLRLKICELENKLNIN